MYRDRKDLFCCCSIIQLCCRRFHPIRTGCLWIQRSHIHPMQTMQTLLHTHNTPLHTLPDKHLPPPPPRCVTSIRVVVVSIVAREDLRNYLYISRAFGFVTVFSACLFSFLNACMFSISSVWTFYDCSCMQYIFFFWRCLEIFRFTIFFSYFPLQFPLFLQEGSIARQKRLILLLWHRAVVQWKVLPIRAGGLWIKRQRSILAGRNLLITKQQFLTSFSYRHFYW